jgi:methylthioribose-1-phosphate isomerase
MRQLIIFFALSVVLHAEDATPLATVEQLQAKVAEQNKQIAELQQRLNQTGNTAQDLSYALRGCKDTLMEMTAKPQIDAQAKQARKPEEKPKP